MNKELLKSIEQIIQKGSILQNESMKNHTTFKVGGNADIFITPGDIKEAEELLRLLCVFKEPFNLIGNGSNLLVSDDGIRGICVCISKGCDEIRCEGKEIYAEAGALLSKVAKAAYDNSLTGFEFASGIPGSAGGAVVMNAGAYGGEMSQVISEVLLFDKTNCKTVSLSGDEMDFSYRHSIVKDYPYIVLGMKIILKEGNAQEIKAVMDDLNGRRRSKQPLEYPSAGSTFKRPEGYFAGKLIEDCGLKGFSVGGAEVSTKHSGFVINKGNATADDIINLIKSVRKKVLDEFGVILEPEVCMIGNGLEL